MTDALAVEPVGTLLQRILIDRPIDRSLLYWRAVRGHSGADSYPEVILHGDRLAVAPGTVLSFDTYFNSFFEANWRRHTSIGAVVLRLDVLGDGILRIFRRAIGRKMLVHEQPISCGRVTVHVPSEAISFRQHGTLCVELAAGTSGLVFVAGGWWSDTPPAKTVGLAAVVCTFGREAEVTRLVATLAHDAVVAATLVWLIVINQGKPGLAESPAMQAVAAFLGKKLAIVDQANLGSAGGFGRGLLAALDDPATTHAVLLDDDILIEPDSLLRMAAFFAFCRRDMVVGGHMLDLVQPNLLYEAGAIVSDRHWEFTPQRAGLAVDNPDVLEVLSLPLAVHYNGWQCCGFPLALVEEHGMPLPCFIRGGDAEFGLRLHMRGVPTVAMPGIAVWHKPFSHKLDDWHSYYETRNLLILASLHLAPSKMGAVRRIGRQIATNLLTFRYHTAALILAATTDFLRGPSAMHDSPAALLARLAAFRSAYPSVSTKRETVLRPQTIRNIPRSRLGFICLLVRLTLRNAIAPTGTTPARLLDGGNVGWAAMRDVEHIAIETWWDDELPTFRRSREHHRSLLRQAIPVLLRLYRGLPAAAAAWRIGAPVLITEAFWRDYLHAPNLVEVGRAGGNGIEPR